MIRRTPWNETSFTAFLLQRKHVTPPWDWINCIIQHNICRIKTSQKRVVYFSKQKHSSFPLQVQTNSRNSSNTCVRVQIPSRRNTTQGQCTFCISKHIFWEYSDAISCRWYSTNYWFLGWHNDALADKTSLLRMSRAVMLFSKLKWMFLGHFDPINLIIYSKNILFLGLPNWCIGCNKSTYTGVSLIKAIRCVRAAMRR